jgi:hypothetical protein
MRGNAGSGPRDGQFSQGSSGPGLAEALVVWALFGVVALCILVTYSRVAPEGLYNVSHDGLAGGASRVLVFLNYPTALAAIAVLALVTSKLGPNWPALVAFLLCLVILVPGVVDQDDLDAKWVNVFPALGVGIALWLTLRADGRGWGDPRGDRLRLGLGIGLAALALPWIFAELGFYLPGPVFLSAEPYEGHAAVHLGEHHGFHGLLLVLTALLLSRELPRMTRLRTPLAVYLSLLIAYGLGNFVNDLWLEQVVKRGWTDWEIPGVIRPDLTWMWGLVVLGGLAIYAVFFSRARPATDGLDGRPRGSP